MRILRAIVFLLGLILIAIGVSQIFFPDTWFGFSRTIAGSQAYLRILGIVAVFFGVILLLAVFNRAVALTSLVAILGIILLVFGVVILISPDRVAEYMSAVFLNRPSGAQMGMLLIAGVIRIMVGIILLFAVTKAQPQPGTIAF